ncbi:DMT family transporter [Comamonadaceae bacterium OH3737_COT-264]|nr:DMT family transporter [Comamonadaceae bacterium OH3737_COT-264]
MNEQRRGSLEMTAAMVISGTIGWMVVSSGRAVAEVVFWRCLFGAATLLPVCWWLGQLRRSVLNRRQLALAACAGVAIVSNWLLLFGAYARTSISIATVVYNTQPFMLVALGALLLGERPGRARWGWLLLSFAGVGLLVQARPGGQDGAYLTGVAMALGAAFCYAVAAFIAKRLTGMPPHLISLVQAVVGAALLWPFALRGAPMAAQSWPWLLTLGVVHTGLMYILLYGAIQRLPTYVTGALSFLYPLVALAVDMVVFAQRPSALQWLGGATVLLGAAGMVLGWRWPGRALGRT